MASLLLVTLELLLLVHREHAAPQTLPSHTCTASSDPIYHPGLLVNCSNQGLTVVPPFLPPEVTTLVLSSNYLSKVHNNAFIHVAQLRDMDLSFSKIVVLEVHAFQGLSKLLKLSLRGNMLALSPQFYPADVFKPLEALQVLDISRQYGFPIDMHLDHERGDKDETFRSLSDSAEVLTFRSDNRQDTPRKSEALPILTAHPVSSRANTKNFSTKGDQTASIFRELNYPDVALSALTGLRNLYMDGLANSTLGPGFGNLTNLTHVDMNGKTGFCSLVTVNSSTFASLVAVTHLNLSDCDMTRVTPDAFSSVVSLQQLDLSYNQALGFDRLGKICQGLNSTNLNTLVVDAVVPVRSLGITITADQLHYFKDLKYLYRVNARFNRLVSVADGALCNSMPPNLRYLNLGGNLLELASYVNDLRCLRSLLHLRIDGMSGSWTPPLRPPDPADQNLKYSHQQLTLGPLYSKNDINMVDDVEDVTEDGMPAPCLGKQFSVPPQLRKFSCSSFGLAYRLVKVHIDPDNNLTTIDLSQNYLPEWKGPLCGFQSVKHLYLMQAQAGVLNNDFFPSFPALEVLNVSGNLLRSVFYNDFEGLLLRGLDKLRVLDLSLNDLGHLQSETLRPLNSLEELYLSINGIGTFNVSLNHMPKIHHIELSKNQLSTIPLNVRDHLDQVALTCNVTVRLPYNPIACSCENIEFLRWMLQSRVRFDPFDNYFCQMADGSSKRMDDIMATVADLDRTCGNFVGVLVGAAASCVLTLTLLLVALAYRYRWKLRYLYYASRLGLQRRHSLLEPDHFHYDAFVSFSSEDHDFVHGELREELEGGLGLRLCLHTRDFVPGHYITSNIVDCVQRSRRTLVVLTQGLLASDWCHYELQMALMEEAHSGRNVLLFLLYQHVPAQELPREVLANLQTNSYIEFPHEESDHKLFWGRLASALRR